MIDKLRSGMDVNERASQAKGPDGTDGFHAGRRKAAAAAVAARAAAAADGTLAASVFSGPAGWRAMQAAKAEPPASANAVSSSAGQQQQPQQQQPSWRDRRQQQPQGAKKIDGDAVFGGGRATRQHQQPQRRTDRAGVGAGQPAEKLSGLALLLSKQG
jgi:hypothetical protein